MGMSRLFCTGLVGGLAGLLTLASNASAELMSVNVTIRNLAPGSPHTPPCGSSSASIAASPCRRARCASPCGARSGCGNSGNACSIDRGVDGGLLRFREREGGGADQHDTGGDEGGEELEFHITFWLFSLFTR